MRNNMDRFKPEHFVHVLLLFLLNIAQSLQCDEDTMMRRDVIFKPELHNKALTGHVIANESVNTIDQCHILCYLEPNCISINFNTKPEVILNCELSSAEDEQYPKNLTDKPGVIYQAMVNNCNELKCAEKNLTCQSGFGFLGYRCVCLECSYGDNCTDDIILSFAQQSSDNTVIVDKPFDEPLSAFTISMWLQLDNRTKQHTPFSYAVNQASHYNEIYVYVENEYIQIAIKEDASNRIRHPIIDGKWHHVCVTWENTHGQVNLFVDGRYSFYGLKAINQNISKGALVLGQDQDSYKSGFESLESFQGNLTSVNVWDKVLPNNEISDLASTCPSREGNVVKWTDLVPHRSSSIKIFCGISSRL